MAVSSTYMSTSANFKMPLEPAPVPSITNRFSSDEESFVVLGKSLADFDESAISLDDVNSIGANIIQEAQQLLSQELALMEKQVQTQTENSQAEKSGETLKPNFEIQAAASTNNPFEILMTGSSGVATVPEKNSMSEMPPTEKSLADTPQDANKLISIVSISPSEIVSEELQQKISQLIDENISLKDTILQNNISMKSQYERIVAWQEDVQKVHISHKEKFIQAKQYIEALKKENYSLKQEVEKLNEALMNVKSENAEQRQQLMESSAKNIAEFELETVNKKLTQELETAKQKLQESKNAALLEEKLLKYEKELEDAYRKIRSLEIEVQKRRSLAEVDLEEAINQMKNVELNKEASVVELETKFNELKKHQSYLQDIVDAKNAMLNETQLKLQAAQIQYDEIKISKEQLEAHVKEIQGELEEAKIETWRNKTNMAEKEKAYQEEIHMMRASGSNAYPPLPLTPVLTYEIENLRQQLMQSQIALTNCEQSRAVTCAQVDAYKNQVEDMTKQLQEIHSQSDDVFALRTQLDVYKADFEAERASKEEIKAEKDKLSEDLQCLHRRNQQLQEEIEMVRPRGSGSSTDSSWTNLTPNQVFKCPKCQFGFKTLNACENHVMACIELDDALP